MTITMRDAVPADHPAVRHCMDQVFRETAGQKTAEFGAELWNWQYLDGEHASLVVVADDNGNLCGYYHALVFSMRREGRTVLAAMVQDVGTLAAYRGKGIFRDMGAYALKRLKEMSVEFIYTFPNERSRPSFERNHRYQRVARVPVWITPLSVSGLVASRLHSPWIKALGKPFSALHRAFRRRGAALPSGTVVQREISFSPTLAALAQAFSQRVDISLVRSVSYLDWRFLQKPNGGYSCWTFNRNGGATAYVVTRVTTLFNSPCLVFLDFGCANGADDDLRRLLAHRLCEEQGTGAMLSVTMGLHPFFRSLGSLGFFRVPERFNPRPFNLLTRVPSGTEPPQMLDSARWHITLADWDVI